MFCLCGFLRNLFPPLTVFDLHKVSWIHASLRRIRDGPCIYTTTRGTQRFRPFVQPNLATREGCLPQRERNALQYRNVVLEKHSFKRVEPVNRYPCHHHRLTPGIYSPESHLVILKTTPRVCSVADRNRQSSRVPLILAPVWMPSQPSNREDLEDWQSMQQTWRRPRRTLLLW